VVLTPCFRVSCGVLCRVLSRCAWASPCISASSRTIQPYRSGLLRGLSDEKRRGSRVAMQREGVEGSVCWGCLTGQVGLAVWLVEGRWMAGQCQWRDWRGLAVFGSGHQPVVDFGPGCCGIWVLGGGGFGYKFPVNIEFITGGLVVRHFRKVPARSATNCVICYIPGIAPPKRQKTSIRARSHVIKPPCPLMWALSP
jgi:hypothetical protein